MPSDGTDARSLSDDVLEVLRLRAIRAREQGYSVGDLAAILGVSRETVSRWYSAYKQGGKDALPGDRTLRSAHPPEIILEFPPPRPEDSG